MKPSIWDILTGVILLGIVVMIGIFGFLLMQPAAAAPGQATVVMPADTKLIPTISIPTATITNTRPPATFTPLASLTPTRKYVTSTPYPTNTPVKLPTFTKSPRPNTGGSGGGAGTCIVVEQTPVDGSFVLANTPVSVAWTIKNTSGKAWRADSVDVRNTGGVSSGTSAYDLTYDVASQGNYQFSVTLNAQGSSGTYRSNWGLYEGDISLCRFFVEYRVP